MKIRSGFVSNSSSSSFICDVCGQDVSGWDMGLYDAEMYECVNGHTFCEEHALNVGDEKTMAINIVEDQIKSLKRSQEKYGEEGDTYYLDRIKDEEEFLAELKKDDYELDFDQISEDYELRYSYPEKGCPICQMETVMDSDMVSYLLKKKRTYKERSERRNDD